MSKKPETTGEYFTKYFNKLERSMPKKDKQKVKALMKLNDFDFTREIFLIKPKELVKLVDNQKFLSRAKVIEKVHATREWKDWVKEQGWKPIRGTMSYIKKGKGR